MRGLACAVAIALLGSGCAIHMRRFDRTAVEPVVDLYCRNPAVAVPTLAGNMVGGIAGLAIAIPVGVVSQSEEAAGWCVLAPALACGAVAGLPFVPLSLPYPEERWEWPRFPYP